MVATNVVPGPWVRVVDLLTLLDAAKQWREASRDAGKNPHPAQRSRLLDTEGALLDVLDRLVP